MDVLTGPLLHNRCNTATTLTHPSIDTDTALLTVTHTYAARVLLLACTGAELHSTLATSLATASHRPPPVVPSNTQQYGFAGSSLQSCAWKPFARGPFASLKDAPGLPGCYCWFALVQSYITLGDCFGTPQQHPQTPDTASFYAR